MKVIFFNEKDDDDGVIVRIWMGPVAPTLANLPICKFCNNHLQILQKVLQFSPRRPLKAPQGHKIFAQIACNFAKIKCKVCKIATFVAIVRYKIALYNANDFVQIVQIVCTNSCKFAN